MTELHEISGPYALHALDDADQAEFEAHLATCPACREEVVAFSETVAELALLSLATPPPTLRTKILDAIRTIPQLPADGAASRSLSPANGTRPTASANGSRPAADALRPVPLTGPRRALPGSETPDEPEPVDELAARRQRRRTRVLSGLVAAMLALAVGLGGVVYTLVQERQAQIAQITLEDELYAAPDATTATLDLEGGGQVTFIASKGLNRALFLGTDLPDPGADLRYQLWTGTGVPAADGGITSVVRDNQVADPDSGVKVFFTGNVAGSDFLAVNVEPAGSTPPAPTNAVLAAAEI